MHTVLQHRSAHIRPVLDNILYQPTLLTMERSTSSTASAASGASAASRRPPSAALARAMRARASTTSEGGQGSAVDWRSAEAYWGVQG
jgi:hypothetical protein